MPPWDLSAFVAVSLVSALFFFVVIVVRWNLIAQPAHRHFLAEIGLVEARLESRHWVCCGAESPGHDPRPVPGGRHLSKEELCAQYASIRKLLDDARAVIDRPNLWDRLFWSRGQEVESLHYFRAADRLLVKLDYACEGPGAIRSRVEEARVELGRRATLGSAEERQLLDHLLDELRQHKRVDSMRLLSALENALEVLHNIEIDRFQESVERLNRMLWMLNLTLLLLTLLSIVFGKAILFLAGAVGGLASRMLALIKEKDIRRGSLRSSWALLLLGPAFGALAGWTGVLLADATSTQILGLQPTWATPGTPQTLALAVLMGFSERLFFRWLPAAEEGLRPKEAERAAEKSPPEQPDASS